MAAILFDSLKRIDLILIGARGQVGRALRQRLHRERAGIAERCGLDLRLLATFDRRGFAFDLEGLDEACIDEALAARTPGDAEALFRHRAQPGQAPTVVIDCTASEDIAQQYPDWLSAGLGVVTANKRGNARELSFYRRIQRAAQRGRAPYRFETTVGAAIPVLGPLRALALRGERVLAIQGVLSGSLSYLLQRLHAGDALSQSLADAQALGYTEPDAGDDLRAEDLVRKLLVLAREAGFALEPADIEVQPFLDRAATHPATWPQHAAEDDAEWHERIAEARAANLRWVMLAEVDASRARVGLRALPATSPFADLSAGQNLVRIETDLQRERPLWLGGPGAGPEITAAGVLSDVIDAAAELAASRYSASTRRSAAA